MIIILILFTHYVADFILQSEYQATRKSFDNKALLLHCLIYSFTFLIPMWIILNSFISAVVFVIITFVLHFITDFFTSKIVSKKFKNNDLGSPIPNFGAFSIIGFDQFIHHATLIITYLAVT